jgi:hypothetical protein
MFIRTIQPTLRSIKGGLSKVILKHCASITLLLLLSHRLSVTLMVFPITILLQLHVFPQLIPIICFSSIGSVHNFL